MKAVSDIAFAPEAADILSPHSTPSYSARRRLCQDFSRLYLLPSQDAASGIRRFRLFRSVMISFRGREKLETSQNQGRCSL